MTQLKKYNFWVITINELGKHYQSLNELI